MVVGVLAQKLDLLIGRLQNFNEATGLQISPDCSGYVV